MNEYREIRDRRIGQFARYLRLMRRRQQDIASGASFIIFSERGTDHGPDTSVLDRSRAAVVPIGVSLHGGLDHADPFDVSVGGPPGQPSEDGYEPDKSHRFIQFSFNPRYFDIDLPNTTLYQPEAAEILACRPGFFYVKDRRQFEHPAEDVPEFDPVRRVYVYGDDRTAAEDMAFIWFAVWKFPVDWRFFVTAAAFHEDTEWESDWPLDVNSVVKND
jgi:hypothetical protein